MSAPAPSLAERFAATLRWLTHAVVTRGITGQLPQALVSLIVDRLRGINQRFARLAARVHAGRYAPRRVTSRRPPTPHRPRRPDPLPRDIGWLLRFVPEAVGATAQLESLFRDPEMAALVAAAPAALRRPLRSLCRMLRVAPPPTLARPVPAQPRPAPPPRVARPADPAILLPGAAPRFRRERPPIAGDAGPGPPRRKPT